MILADKIINERKKNGWSQEELAEKLSVSRQSVSKWESAQAVPDLQKVLKLAEIFGVSTDYLLKDEIEIEEAPSELSELSNPEPPVIKISMEEANEYIAATKITAPKRALGVSACMLSPLVLIFLAGLSESKMFGITENIASAIGLFVLFLVIAGAVFTFITINQNLKKYDYIKTSDFETEYGVSGMVKSQKAAFEARTNKYTAIGVIMCIMSPFPLIASAFITEEAYIIVNMVCLLIIIIAVAVNLFVRVGCINECYKALLQEEDFTKKSKAAARKLSPITSIYWTIALTIFLGWSFITMRWDRTWIVWPIASVLYGALHAILTMFLSKDE